MTVVQGSPFAGMTVGCGGLPKGVDGRVWMPPQGGRRRVWSLPRGVPRQTTGCPPPETFAQPSFPRRREPRFGGSPLGMLAISATLSPTGGVTQTSASAGMTVGCGGLHEGVDGRVWVPPERSAPPDHWMPASGDLCTTVIPAQATIAQPSFPRRRESRFGGSPLGMLAISATLSPTGGVTQTSPSAGMTVGCGGLPEGVDGRVWMPRQGGS